MARSSSKDPLEKFRFKVVWTDSGAEGSEGSALVRAGFHDAQMPKRSTNKIMYREGTDKDISSVSAGLSTMEDVVLSRGLIAADVNGEFYKWASSVHAFGPTDSMFDTAVSGEDQGEALNYRKDVSIVMFDRTGAPARAWTLYNAFPTNFVPGADLDAAEDGEKSLESLTLAYEDFAEVAKADLSTFKPQAAGAGGDTGNASGT